MKTFKFSLVLIIVFSMTASAQTSEWTKGPYLQFNAGYGISISPQNMSDYPFYFYNYTEVFNETEDYEKYELVDVSLGKGFAAGGAFGYMFSKHIGAELGFSYLYGTKTTAEITYRYGTEYRYLMESNLYSRMFRLNPSIIVASGLEKVNPYARFGMVFGFGKALLEVDDSDTYLGETDTYHSKFEMKNGVGIGVTAGVGAMFSLNDQMSLFTEINMISMSYSPKKGEIVELSYNGEDHLSELSTSEKEVEFVKEIIYDYENPDPYDEDKPSEELQFKIPYSSIGLNVGWRFSF
ncbi:MAG: outer membrane beta-barrel protein [Chitinophagales bacterium]|nr:outer membrane beta-barrel protein [Chitinophagales bacterium]